MFDGLNFEQVVDTLGWETQGEVGPCPKYTYIEINGILLELYPDGHWNIDAAPHNS